MGAGEQGTTFAKYVEQLGLARKRRERPGERESKKQRALREAQAIAAADTKRTQRRGRRG